MAVPTPRGASMVGIEKYSVPTPSEDLKIEKRIRRGALEYGAPPQRSLCDSPCHWWTVLAHAVPSGRPRACGTRARARELPRSGSLVPAMPAAFRFEAAENKKPSGACGSGGSAKRRYRRAIRRCRSHEPCAYIRMAGGHSLSRSVFVRGKSLRSTQRLLAHTMCVRARLLRPRFLQVNAPRGILRAAWFG